MKVETLFTNSLWNVIATNASQNPNDVILKDVRNNECTYTCFVNDVDEYAFLLMKQGVARGDRVLFLERPSMRAVKIFFAIYRLGAVAVIVDPAMGRENFISRIEFSGCKFVSLDPVLSIIKRAPIAVSILRKLYPSIPDLNIKLPGVIVLPGHIKHTHQSYREQQLEDSNDALIIFTSGTTSVPKGVVHSFLSLFETLKLIQKEIAADSNDIFLSSQLHFSIIALISGATAILDTGTTFNAKRFLSQVRNFKPTHTFLLPAEGQQIIDVLNSNQQRVSDSLKYVMFGSAPVLTGFLERFTKIISPCTQVLCIYGSTEILPISITTATEKLSFKSTGDYLGKPLSGIKVQVENEEFLVSGPNLCKRYLNEKDTLAKFVSGDLGFIANNEALILTSRKKDMIIRNHNNVYPALFEPTISKIQGVKNCALVGVYSDKKQDEEIHLCVEKGKDNISDNVLINHIQRELKSGACSIDAYAFPDKIHIMSLPVSGRSRKLDKLKIRKMILETI